MSIVIGLVTKREEDGDKKTFIGGDFLVSEGNVVRTATQAKVFLRDIKWGHKIGIGVVGTPALMTGLKYDWEIPDAPRYLDSVDVLDKYVYSSLAPCIASFEKDRNGTWGTDAAECGVIIAIDQYIWSMDSHFSATRSRDRYDAIGSGWQLSLGALAALQGSGDGLRRQDLAVALRVAGYLDESCGADSEIIEVPRW